MMSRANLLRAAMQLADERTGQGGCISGLQHHPSDVPWGTRSRVLVSPKSGAPK